MIQDSCVDGTLPARIALIVGPEGGIGAEETAQLVDAGARTIGLGGQRFAFLHGRRGRPDADPRRRWEVLALSEAG